MLITVSTTIPEPPIQVAGDNLELRVWYDANFTSYDGVTPIESGNGQTGFYYSISCSKDVDGNVVIPAFTIEPTTLSNPTANFFGQLWVNGAPNQMIFGEASGWQMPTLFGASINYGELALYNRARRLLYPNDRYLTEDDVIRLINLMAGAQNYAGLNILGRTELSVAPVAATKPVAVGNNDPRVQPASLTNVGVAQLSVNPLVAIVPIAVGNNDPRAIDISSYASFATAVAAIGSTPTTFNITSAITGIATVTLPATLSLRFLQGGSMAPATGQTITITGPIIADPTIKIFNNALSGQGTISLLGNKNPVVSVTWWGAAIDGTTDDTAAWSAARAAIYTAKVGVIRQPTGISLVSSVVFPAYSSAGNEGVSVTIEGIGQPPTEAGSFPGTLAASTKSSVIKSTTASTAGVITQAGSPFEAVSLTLKNLIIRREDDPTGPAVDWTNGFGLYLENVIIDTGRYTTAVVQPTHPAAVGIITPGASNAGTQSIRGDCWIQGYYTGMVVGEHTCQSGHLVISGCAEALNFPTGQLHPVSFTKLQTYNCTTFLKFAGAAYINIQEWAIEHANNNGVPAWQETVYDIDDASNLGRGKLRYNVIKAFIGADSTFTRNGGYYLSTDELKHESEKSVFVRNSANITIADNIDTILTFNTVDDNQAKADLSNTARIKLTQYGVVDVFTNIRWAANATGFRTVQIYKHTASLGEQVIATEQIAAGSAALPTIMSVAVPASATNIVEYFYVVVKQTSGGPLDVIATADPDFTSPRFIVRY